MHVYIYIYICIHIHIYIYIYTHTCELWLMPLLCLAYGRAPKPPSPQFDRKGDHGGTRFSRPGISDKECFGPKLRFEIQGSPRSSRIEFPPHGFVKKQWMPRHAMPCHAM